MKTEYRKVTEKYKKIIQEQKKVIIILAITVFTIVSLFSLVYIPPWRVAQFGINDSVKIAELENSYRATIAQIIGGFAIIIGLYYTWQRITIAENNLKVAQEGQITERFTRAINQLGAIDQFGNPAIEIRLGGIYALERIADESEKDCWPVIEILTAYVRKNSNVDSILNEKNRKNEKLEMDIQANESIEEKKSNVRSASLDIQAILTVLGKHKYSSDAEGLQYIDLQETDLRFANLIRADLENGYLDGAYLDETILTDSNLKGCYFYRAHFEGAILVRANLKGSLLEDAFFEDALLGLADFTEANLEGAKNLTVDQLSKVKTLYNAKLDKELEIPLREKYPDLFKEPKE